MTIALVKPVTDEDHEPLGIATKDGMFISNERLLKVNPDLHAARRMVRQALMDLKEPRVIRGPTAKPTDVRIAGPDDERAVYDLVIMDLEENARIAPIHPNKVANLIMSGTRRQGGIVGVIDGADKKPVAVEILALDIWWWSQQRFIQKVVDFVHPAHRQSTHAAHLIQFAKWATDKWTEQFGHQMYLLGGTLGPKRTRDKGRFYSRHISQMGVACLYPYPLPWEG